MTDREMLELAAKAAGYHGVEHQNGLGLVAIGQPEKANMLFNPLTSDGDALRLAVDLRIDVYPWISKEDPASSVMARNSNGFRATEFASENRGCRHAATRRAITRAAAEIGRLTP